LSVAIDFTGSNGNPMEPGTLHSLHPHSQTRNDYEKVILSLGTILGHYDSDQMYPLWGFGAKYGGVVRHCFQCGPSAQVSGVDGILKAYHSVFQSGLIMSGPTAFDEVIMTAAAQAVSAQEAASKKGEQIYTILLILTDGSVSDVNKTVTALEAVSDAPLSVVVIGIGTADFRGMRFIDDGRPNSKTRDIAQFVEFNKHSSSVASFTENALQELPEQLVGYFKSQGIAPLPAVKRGNDDMAVLEEEEEIDLSLVFGEDDEIVVTAGGYSPQFY